MNIHNDKHILAFTTSTLLLIAIIGSYFIADNLEGFLLALWICLGAVIVLITSLILSSKGLPSIKSQKPVRTAITFAADFALFSVLIFFVFLATAAVMTFTWKSFIEPIIPEVSLRGEPKDAPPLSEIYVSKP